MASLNGKVAIVAGSSRGIGRAIAERFAADGAAVVVNCARSEDEARSVVRAIEAKGGKATAIKADAGVVADIRRLFRETIAKFGRVDIVVNNAGLAGDPKPIAEITEKEFDETFAVFGRGPVLRNAGGGTRASGRRSDHQHFNGHDRAAYAVLFDLDGMAEDIQSLLKTTFG